MQNTLVMTLLGPDRPGIVETLSDLVRSHEGNWLESRLAHLAGHFAGIVLIHLPPAREPSFRAALQGLEHSTGLQCLVAESQSPAEAEDGELIALEVVGQDRPGIVHAVTDALNDFHANVESLESSCVSAPMSGETLFRISLTVRLPKDTDLDALEKKLSGLGDELMLDVRVF